MHIWAPVCRSAVCTLCYHIRAILLHTCIRTHIHRYAHTYTHTYASHIHATYLSRACIRRTCALDPLYSGSPLYILKQLSLPCKLEFLSYTVFYTRSNFAAFTVRRVREANGTNTRSIVLGYSSKSIGRDVPECRRKSLLRSGRFQNRGVLQHLCPQHSISNIFSFFLSLPPPFRSFVSLSFFLTLSFFLNLKHIHTYIDTYMHARNTQIHKHVRTHARFIYRCLLPSLAFTLSFSLCNSSLSISDFITRILFFFSLLAMSFFSSSFCLCF